MKKTIAVLGAVLTLGSPQLARSAEQAPACADVLSSAFQETKVKHVYSFLQAEKLAKDQFETKDAYAARVEATLQRLQDQLREGSASPYIVFSKQVSDGAVKYDADAGTLSIGTMYSGLFDLSFEAKSLSASPNLHWRIVPVERLVTRTDLYEGSNAYGAKAQIRLEEADEYGVAFVDAKSWLRTSWPSDNFKATVEMDPTAARAAVNNIHAVFVGKLITPYTAEKDDTVSPTIHRPVDLTTHMKLLTVNAECIGLVDKTSGRLLHRIK